MKRFFGALVAIGALVCIPFTLPAIALGFLGGLSLEPGDLHIHPLVWLLYIGIFVGLIFIAGHGIKAANGKGW